jgi:hypothetical protein
MARTPTCAIAVDTACRRVLGPMSESNALIKKLL